MDNDRIRIKSQDLVSRIGYEEVGVIEGQWEGMKLEETQDGVGGRHQNVQDKIYFLSIMDVGGFNLE